MQWAISNFLSEFKNLKVSHKRQGINTQTRTHTHTIKHTHTQTVTSERAKSFDISNVSDKNTQRS